LNRVGAREQTVELCPEDRLWPSLRRSHTDYISERRSRRAETILSPSPRSRSDTPPGEPRGGGQLLSERSPALVQLTSLGEEIRRRRKPGPWSRRTMDDCRKTDAWSGSRMEDGSRWRNFMELNLCHLSASQKQIPYRTSNGVRNFTLADFSLRRCDVGKEMRAI